MRCLFISAFLFSLAATAFPSSAQEPVQEPVEIGEAGTDYLRAIRLRGIDADVVYYDPAAPAPELDTTAPELDATQQPRPETRDNTGIGPFSGVSGRWTFALIAGLVLAAIIYLFLRYGGHIAVSLNRDAENAERRRSGGAQGTPVWAEKLGSFNDILHMEDKRRALVLLTQKVLATLAAANGVLMQRSWTARDTLKYLPLAQPQQSALRALVLNSERVQFGGRDVSEAEFREHVSTCRQLLGPGTA